MRLIEADRGTQHAAPGDCFSEPEIFVFPPGWLMWQNYFKFFTSTLSGFVHKTAPGEIRESWPSSLVVSLSKTLFKLINQTSKQL